MWGKGHWVKSCLGQQIGQGRCCSRLIWLGTILSFRRNNQGTLLPYYGCSRSNDMTQRLKVVPSSVTSNDIAGDYLSILYRNKSIVPSVTLHLIFTSWWSHWLCITPVLLSRCERRFQSLCQEVALLKITKRRFREKRPLVWHVELFEVM